MLVNTIGHLSKLQDYRKTPIKPKQKEGETYLD